MSMLVCFSVFRADLLEESQSGTRGLPKVDPNSDGVEHGHGQTVQSLQGWTDGWPANH
jgi:hypothetical protein